MLLEQLVRDRVGRMDCVLLCAICDHRLWFLNTAMQPLGCSAPIVGSPSFSGWNDFPGFKGLPLCFPPVIFHFFPFQEADIRYQDIQNQLQIQGKLESDHTWLGRGSERQEKIWNLQLGPILHTETAYNNRKNKQTIKKITKQQQTLGKWVGNQH